MGSIAYLQELLFAYSEFGINMIARAAVISGFVLTLLIILFSVLIRKIYKKQNLRYQMILISFLKGLRLFIIFLSAYILLLVIKEPMKAEYPVSLILRAFELAVLYSGFITAVLKMIKDLKKSSIETLKDAGQPSGLEKLSVKGLNFIVFLLVFSLYISRLKRDFASELKTELWISLIVLVNSILLLVVLFVAVEKILPQIQNYITKQSPAGIAGKFLSVISGPLKIFFVTIFLFSLKAVIPDPGQFSEVNSKLIELCIYASLILLLYKLVDIFVSRLSKYSELETNSLDKTLIEMIRMIIRVFFITAFIFLTIRIFTGKPLTTLLAGLGIGGLAVALAAQDTLKNFFGSIMIMTDKPFKVGERILADGYDGVIESIGFRSTRIRTLTGNQVVIPNDRVAQSPIENIGRRPSIRRLTNITITYSTSPEKVERALSIIREILDNHEGMLPDMPPRVYFNEFNADSLNILMLYWYSPPDYWAYMRFTEEVNLKIMKSFAAEGIDFAFPTHTTYLEQEDGKSIKLDLNGAGK